MNTPFATGLCAAIALAGALAIPLSAQAQNNISNLRPTAVQGGRLDLTAELLKAHRDDLENMTRDLARVTNAKSAKSYEGYLDSQMPRYMQNHQRLHALALQPAQASLQAKRPVPESVRRLVAQAEQLDETHFPRLAAEMDRVEQLNPALKPRFDALRNLD